jgi:hypothetical protein
MHNKSISHMHNKQGKKSMLRNASGQKATLPSAQPQPVGGKPTLIKLPRPDWLPADSKAELVQAKEREWLVYSDGSIAVL